MYVFKIDGKVDSVKFVSLNQDQAVPVFKSHFGEETILFQHDNAPIHNSKFNLPRLEQLGLEVLKWPSRSPDLKIMENIWKMISDIVYDGPQYDTYETLWDAIYEAGGKDQQKLKMCLPDTISIS